MIAFMIALNISAGCSGYLLGRVVHYKLWPMIGLALSICAILVMAWHVDLLNLIWFQAIMMTIGFGFGAMPGLTQVAVQNSVERHQLGISVGTMTFTRNLLATFMIAVFGAIVSGVAIRAGLRRLASSAARWRRMRGMAAEAYRRVFFATAATMTVALSPSSSWKRSRCSRASRRKRSSADGRGPMLRPQRRSPTSELG